MRLAIQGSRTLGDERAKILILEEIDKYNITEIVTAAEPDGACKVARDLCKTEGLPLTLHFLNFKYRRGAFEHRSKAVLNDCDRVLFIHDGKSKGTSNEFKLAQKMKKEYNIHTLEPSEHKVSVGFKIIKEWGSDDTPLAEQLKELDEML